MFPVISLCFTINSPALSSRVKYQYELNNSRPACIVKYDFAIHFYIIFLFNNKNNYNVIERNPIILVLCFAAIN